MDVVDFRINTMGGRTWRALMNTFKGGNQLRNAIEDVMDDWDHNGFLNAYYEIWDETVQEAIWAGLIQWTPSNHPSCNFTETFPSPELAATLTGRGWVYQERLLSPRVLHFGHTDLYWECNNVATCQCGKWRQSGSRHRYAAFPKVSHTGTVQSVSEGDTAVLRYRWQRIVTEFSSMAVTYESDRLPAVAGIARQFWERRQELEYVVDLYKVRLDSLPDDNTNWTTCEPGWMERPGDDPERYVEHKWWEPEPRMSCEVLVLLNWQSSPLRWWRETFESCEEFAESVWCLFIKFWDGTHAYHISLVLRRVVESPEKFARVGLLLYGPERLPIYEEGFTTIREVVLV
ncbi:hypothetical protein B0T14DRAFT_601121 [Immersiella caudata]|uniref:Uncharacterized protein n=1 Tax=Immersiella caudata TaxID=314043 RepID=A0AA39WVF1_9PEZI|nr:hypothetical protein B0T14DRAFT_601121 [Immersiella caudata]